MIDHEKELKEFCGQAAELFRQHKYNFVRVSPDDLDCIMELCAQTPGGQYFVCDAYLAEVILTALRGREDGGNSLQYPHFQQSGNQRKHYRIYIAGGARHWGRLRGLGSALKNPVIVGPVTPDRLERDGFVMLSCKNEQGVFPGIFEEMCEKFYPVDGQIICAHYADRHILQQTEEGQKEIFGKWRTGEKWLSTNGIKIGDIFEMWEFCSLLTCYYQVTGFRGEKLVCLRLIQEERFINEGISEDSPLYWRRKRCRPLPGQFDDGRDFGFRPWEAEPVARVTAWNVMDPDCCQLREWGHGGYMNFNMVKPEYWAVWDAETIRKMEEEERAKDEEYSKSLKGE